MVGVSRRRHVGPVVDLRRFGLGRTPGWSRRESQARIELHPHAAASRRSPGDAWRLRLLRPPSIAQLQKAPRHFRDTVQLSGPDRDPVLAGPAAPRRAVRLPHAPIVVTVWPARLPARWGRGVERDPGALNAGDAAMAGRRSEAPAVLAARDRAPRRDDVASTTDGLQRVLEATLGQRYRCGSGRVLRSGWGCGGGYRERPAEGGDQVGGGRWVRRHGHRCDSAAGGDSAPDQAPGSAAHAHACIYGHAPARVAIEGS